MPGRGVRHAPHWPSAILLAITTLLLAGCATTRAPPRTLLPVEAQEQLLHALPGFELEGRAGLKAGNASLDWQQSGEQVAVRLAGMLGAGSLRVSWSPTQLTITDSRGEVYEDADAEAVMLQEIGFVPPFDALRYWMLGLEAPGEAATLRTPSTSGRIGSLIQRQWNISYDQWMSVAADAGGVQLPRRVTITRDDLRLRVFVDRWKL